ncbi:SDR family oxidoreductase [Candidatus Woesebacteria bacterium]|nr:MAG: SDR family oxidoreductase [Candidatus Woesebacteria bacterium]
MKKIIITGGAGFIGSHLCDELIKKDYQIVCVDNLITGSEDNIKHLKKNKNFKFAKLDVVKDKIEEKDIDYIFHLASPASPIDYQNYPEETALVNSVGTINILNLARKTGARVLIASTSEVYGDPKEHPQKESYWGNVNSFGPRSCYDESKRFAETMTYIYIHKYGVDARIVRIFNTYGPRMKKDDGRVISNFINQAIEGRPLTVYGKGDRTRSFCYVSDMIDGIVKAMFTEGLIGEIINLGKPEEYKILDLAKKIKKLAGSKSKIVFKPPLPDDPEQRRPDISKAKKLLKWQPKVSVDEGLRKTIEYYRSLKKN